MKRKLWLVGAVGLAATMLGAASASAQYYDDGYRRGYDRGYERSYEGPPRGGYDRGGYDRGGYDRGGYDRGGSDRGYDRRNDDRGRAYAQPQQRRSSDPMEGMSLDERKQAIKNHREAQKKAIKRGYVIP